MVGAAAREYARALYLTDLAEGLKDGSPRQLKLFAEARAQEAAARSNLLAAYSRAAIEAKARGLVPDPYDPAKAEEEARKSASEKLARIKRVKVIDTTGEEA
jgi:hypothetical protein